MAEGARHVRVKEAVEEVFAGFAADREAAGNVGTRSETALNGVADSHVFILHFFADFDTGLIFLERFCTDVGEIVVEDDSALVHGEREDEVSVQDAFVGIEHEIGIDPKIKRAALAGGGDVFLSLAAGFKRTGLQARALEILDGIAGVFDNAREAFMSVWNVVAAVEIVIHVDFPIALERIDAAVEKFELFGELERRNEIGNFTEKLLKRSGFTVEIDEDEILPSLHGDGDKTVFRAIEIADAVKFDHAFE